MGTFAGLFCGEGSRVPEEKKEEFRKQIEKLFRVAGMMEMEHAELCGKEIWLLKRASMHEHGMDFNYNYFENGRWENAGFSREGGYVWSNKVGWKHFCKAVVAAYTLEALYRDGLAFPMVDGIPELSPAYIGWINYVLHEQFVAKNNNPWDVFEAAHHQSWDLSRFNWEEFVEEPDGLMGYFEVLAVQEGTDAVDKKLRGMLEHAGDNVDDGNLNLYSCITGIKEALMNYHNESGASGEGQLAQIVGMLRIYFEQGRESLCSRMWYESQHMRAAQFFLVASSVPAYTAKAAAEIYGIDFWELWGQLGRTERKKTGILMADVPQEPVRPVTTMEFFGVGPDDMIPFWGEDEEIQFSDGLKEWFGAVKSRYMEILGGSTQKENPLPWILELLQDMSRKFKAYAFSEFFMETLCHLTDGRFLALWSLCEEILHHAKAEKEADVVPDWMKSGNNKTGNPICRFMALIGNVKLRKEVFGF